MDLNKYINKDKIKKSSKQLCFKSCILIVIVLLLNKIYQLKLTELCLGLFNCEITFIPSGFFRKAGICIILSAAIIISFLKAALKSNTKFNNRN